MPRLILFIALLLSCAIPAAAATAPTSDPSAITLAQKSIAALTSGASISDVTLSANVTSIWGSDYETGSGTFSALGWGQSRVDLNLSGGTRSDVRNLSNGTPGGAWSANSAPASAYANHNCWSEAAWFFPALTSLSQFANASFIFRYVGLEQHSGVTVQHIQSFQVSPQDKTGTIQLLSTTDFYLDANSLLPVAVAFNEHADNNLNNNFPIEIRFANYQQPAQGVLVPYHFQKLFNGTLVQDVTVTGAALNTGISSATFSLQ
jgi:hypothetical protein